jgi:hypothetical protein
MNGKRVFLAGILFSSAMALVATGADLSGPLAYTPIAPCRFADTRKTGPAYPCPYGAPALMAGEYRSLPVEGPIAGGAGVFASGEPGVVGSGSMVGVSGQAFGYGVEAQGNSAPLHLVPSTTGVAGPPPSGDHQMGEFYVDSVGALFYCRVSGTPGTWVALAP